MNFWPLIRERVFGPVEYVVFQIPRALVVSVLAAAVDFSLLVLLVESVGFDAMIAAVVAYLAGGIVQYILCSLWVFPGAPSTSPLGFLTFTLLSLGGLLITETVIGAGQAVGFVPYPVAKVIALGLAFCWNFCSRKYILFSGTAGRVASYRLDRSIVPSRDAVCDEGGQSRGAAGCPLLP
jgi:putative flippase GtrA